MARDELMIELIDISYNPGATTYNLKITIPKKEPMEAQIVRDLSGNMTSPDKDLHMFLKQKAIAFVREHIAEMHRD